MATFVLKKYEDKPQPEFKQVQPEGTEEKQEEGKKETTRELVDKIAIKADASISEILAVALNNIMKEKNNSNLELEEVEDEKEEAVNGEVKQISTEDINKDPLKALGKVEKGDVVYISNEGFKTRAEEWFLLNVTSKTDNVFYSQESLIKFITGRLGI